MGLRQIQEPETTMSGIEFRDVVGCQLKIGGQSISIFGTYLTSEVGIAVYQDALVGHRGLQCDPDRAAEVRLAVACGWVDSRPFSSVSLDGSVRLLDDGG
eukprot:2028227-Pyramimonas_sp.AAC.1